MEGNLSEVKFELKISFEKEKNKYAYQQKLQNKRSRIYISVLQILILHLKD